MRLTQPKLSKMSKSVVDRAAQYRHLRTLYNSSSDDQTEMALEDALVEQEKLLADFQLYKEGRNGRSEAEWTALSQSERVKEWLVLGGKIPEPVCRRVDTWLRQAMKTSPRAVLPISFPSAQEETKQAALRK